MLSSQKDQHDRIETLRNDQKVRQQTGDQRVGATFLDFAQSAINDEAGGRFARIQPQVIVGADPIPNYPAAAPHQADVVGQEPALGYSVEETDGASTGHVVDARRSFSPVRVYRRIK
jgi:hypothetical protein